MTPRRYGIILGVLVLALVAGFWRFFYEPNRVGQRLTSGGYAWIVGDVATRTLWGRTQIDLTARIAGATGGNGGKARSTPDLLRGLCGTVLTDPGKIGVTVSRQQVFQVLVTLKNSDNSPTTIVRTPVNVRDGDCRMGLERGFANPRYPEPLYDWMLKSASIRADDTAGDTAGEVIFEFEWDGEGAAALRAFPFGKACEAVLTIAPTPDVDRFFGETAVRRIKINARARTGLPMLNFSRGLSQVFQSAGKTCTPFVEGKKA